MIFKFIQSRTPNYNQSTLLGEAGKSFSLNLPFTSLTVVNKYFSVIDDITIFQLTWSV